MEAKINNLKKKIKDILIGDIIYSEAYDSFYVVSLDDEADTIYLHNLKGKKHLFDSENNKNIFNFTNSLNESSSLGLKHFPQLNYYLNITEKEEL